MSITDIFNVLHGWYTSMPWLIQETLYIVFIYGLFRRYIGKDIETEVDKRGWFKDGLIHTVVRHAQIELQRLKVILKHDIDTARGFRHDRSLEHCTYGKCSTL